MINRQKRYRMRTKTKLVEGYGGKCVCCGIKNIEFLTIDHIENGGRKHLKNLGGNQAFYRYLIVNNFPKDKFRLLCMNCNVSRTKNGGECIHKGSKPLNELYKSENWLAVRKSDLKTKIKVFKKYGNSCGCCGELNVGFLTINHTNKNGSVERSQFENRTIYRNLRDSKLREDISILCMNCNFADGKYGYCPHNTVSIFSQHADYSKRG